MIREYSRLADEVEVIDAKSHQELQLVFTGPGINFPSIKFEILARISKRCEKISRQEGTDLVDNFKTVIKKIKTCTF